MTETNGDRARRYLEAVASLKAAEDVAAFYAPDVVLQEFPNRIAPRGRIRRAEEMRAAYGKGQQLLRSQTFEVRRLVECGDEVAAEVEWTGTLAMSYGDLPAGAEMKAYVGMFLTFRDGKIVSQRQYDCYPPFGEAFVP
ncbi:MAG TPA: nuclear transport factor 2 family protein [Bryobacteraceae bacterium]|jgi:ketosteroid isomerase-like protein